MDVGIRHGGRGKRDHDGGAKALQNTAQGPHLSLSFGGLSFDQACLTLALSA